MANKIPDPGTPMTVRLLKPHTHNDTPMNPGDPIELMPDQIAWLASLGVVDPAPVTE